MADRTPFPPPPGKNVVTNRDGTMNLGWLNWMGALSYWVQRVRVISTDIDLPSISAGSAAYADVTVVGAKLGDFAAASLDPMDAELSVTAQVSADDNVRVWVQNFGASPIDLAAGTLRIRLERAR